MNLSPILSDMLVENGIDANHWYRIGDSDATDSEIIQYAKEHELVILTCDLDFSTILSVTRGHKPSIIQLRTQAYDLEKVANILTYAITQYKEELENGAILSINARNSRIRLLPL
jgi:predicted nuclease of predicted toxin-antitoxin system